MLGFSDDSIVGPMLGSWLKDIVGCKDGALEGSREGFEEGRIVGFTLGFVLCTSDGRREG